MEMKVSDVLDRWTILKQKERIAQGRDGYDEIRREFCAYELEVQKIIKECPCDVYVLTSRIVELMEANAKIWENEAAIRKEFDNDPANSSVKDDDYQEIGRRAIIIREYNSLRNEAKRKIDTIYSQPRDIKVNHASK